MRLASPYTLTADTPINLLQEIGERQSDNLSIRFISEDAEAYLIIRLNNTVDTDANEIILYSGEAYDIPASRIPNVNPIISVMTNITGSQVFW